jgi:hypothetical protein
MADGVDGVKVINAVLASPRKPPCEDGNFALMLRLVEFIGHHRTK